MFVGQLRGSRMASQLLWGSLRSVVLKAEAVVRRTPSVPRMGPSTMFTSIFRAGSNVSTPDYLHGLRELPRYGSRAEFSPKLRRASCAFRS